MQRTPAYISTRKIYWRHYRAPEAIAIVCLYMMLQNIKYKLQSSTTRSHTYNQMMSRVFGYVYRTVYLSLLAFEAAISS
jgi:hypothetical protein